MRRIERNLIRSSSLDFFNDHRLFALTAYTSWVVERRCHRQRPRSGCRSTFCVNQFFNQFTHNPRFDYHIRLPSMLYSLTRSSYNSAWISLRSSPSATRLYSILWTCGLDLEKNPEILVLFTSPWANRRTAWGRPRRASAGSAINPCEAKKDTDESMARFAPDSKCAPDPSRFEFRISLDFTLGPA